MFWKCNINQRTWGWCLFCNISGMLWKLPTLEGIKYHSLVQFSSFHSISYKRKNWFICRVFTLCDCWGVIYFESKEWKITVISIFPFKQFQLILKEIIGELKTFAIDLSWFIKCFIFRVFFSQSGIIVNGTDDFNILRFEHELYQNKNVMYWGKWIT